MPAARSSRLAAARVARAWLSDGPAPDLATILVLPAAHRLTDSDGFKEAVRRGRRQGSRRLVVHLSVQETDSRDAAPVRIGFVVSKAVGNAVVRNRVKRRLRHLTREHLADLASLPGSAVLVVRALPPAAQADAVQLRVDLARCLHEVMA